MQYNNILQKYCVASFAYCTVRKPIVIRNHKVLTYRSRCTYEDAMYDTYYDPYNGSDREFRKLLIAETIPLVAMAAVMGIYTFPFLFMKDMCHLELKMRGLDANEYKEDTRHVDLWSLLSV